MTPSSFASAQHSAIRPSSEKEFAFVAESGSDAVGAYAINLRNGELTPVAGSPFSTGAFPVGVAIDTIGRTIYVTNYADTPGSISAYVIDARNGRLNQLRGSPFPAGNGPQGIAVTPAGTFAYVANTGSSNVSAYAIRADGALRQLRGSPYSVGSSPVGIAIDPTGQLLVCCEQRIRYRFGLCRQSHDGCPLRR